ncbi:hypothetical protein FRC08_017027 [Ceratobasidium sp. 394]|nr:hypothetical protein FRC08_017027 [Ceratobasidium sp. 394]
MFDIGGAFNSALTRITAPPSLPNASHDVAPNFDWRQPSRQAPSNSLSVQKSASDPRYDWSTAGSFASSHDRVSAPFSAHAYAPSTRTTTPLSTYAYSSGTQTSTPSSVYTCVSDSRYTGVQFRPITPFAPTPYIPAPHAPPPEVPTSDTPTLHAPTPHVATPHAPPFTSSPLPSNSFGQTRPPSGASTQSFVTARSTLPSTPTPGTFRPIAHPPASGPSTRPASHFSPILGQPNGLLPTSTSGEWHTAESPPKYSPGRDTDSTLDKARPLFRPETPPSYETTPASPQRKKRKASPAENNPMPKQRRRTAKEVIELESDSDEFEGMEVYDTGYQSVDDEAKAKTKATTTQERKVKGGLAERPVMREADFEEDDEHESEDVEAPVKVKKELVKQEPTKGGVRARPTKKFVPFGSTWTGPKSGQLKFNAKAAKPAGWVDGIYTWSYSTKDPVSPNLSDRMTGDVHFCQKSPYDEDEPFTSWVVKADSKGIRWVQFSAGQPHPTLKGWVLQEAQLPKSPPRWVKEATFKAKY